MKPLRKSSVSLLSGLTALGMLSVAAAAAPPGPVTEKNVTVTFISAADLLQARSVGKKMQMPVRSQRMSLTSNGPAASVEFNGNGGQWGDWGHVPLWTYAVRDAGRDGLDHVGAMVGTSPFWGKETSRIPVVIVPMIITTHAVATGLKAVTTQTGSGAMTSTIVTRYFVTVPGDVTQNSAAPDNNCLAAPNNVPSRLIYQSPIFQKARFTFGGKYMGNTQYIDAVQRANFYQALGGNPGNYHVLFSPVHVLSPIKVDVPSNEGLAVDAPGSGQPNIFGTCGTVQFLDINWFDSYINGTVLPQLAAEGIGAGTIPVFFLYDTNLTTSPVADLDGCCTLGYHSAAGEPSPSQLYAVAETDVTNLFNTPAVENTGVLAHELGELVNDPYGDNEVPPWGDSGQTAGCQENLEVGDPLTGTAVTPVTMPNGYTYQLQELAFFSWFYGGRSLGVDGWYSNGGTFTSDAGPVCGSSEPPTTAN